jgi:DNA helicase-2/ATP-dependent DNA helicase PcrA
MRSLRNRTPDLFALASGTPAGEGAGALPAGAQSAAAPLANSSAAPASIPPRAPEVPAATDSKSALLEGLNPAQAAAVQHERGPLLILAGAGSGKTRVITRRIAYLVAERGASPGQILAITFTNKAAGEMRARVGGLSSMTGAWISTFHALCARILRREIEILGDYTRDFSIYDTTDRNQLLKQLIAREGFDTTRFKPALVGAWISDRKNRMDLLPGGREAQIAGDAGSAGLEEEMFEAVWRAYETSMRSANALDFDDLLLKVLEVFNQHPGVRDSYAQRFVQVMVDEYQDTNRVQYLLMRHFAGFHGNIGVCGDPDQSIYGWRGADVRNILDFEHDFPGAFVVRLEQNYRTSQNILDAAQALIRHNRQRKEKNLWSDRGPGEKLALLECADEDEEAREIAAAIRGLERDGQRLDGIAIFYRVNFMQRAIERALRLAQIPYQIVAGTEFYQRREIKDLIAWLKLVVNPLDNEAAKRALAAPSRGVGDKTLEVLAQFAADRRIGLIAASGSAEMRSQVRGRAKAALEAFATIIERIAPLKEQPAQLALTLVIEEIDYFTWLESSAESSEVDRSANVDELLTYAAEYDQATPDGGLRGFLQDIALVSDSDAYAAGEPKVPMLTLHAA